jgi:beta-lactamase class A
MTEEYIRAQAETFPGRVAVLYKDMTDSSSETVSIRAGEQVVSASMIKVPVMLAILDMVRNGHLGLDDMITVRDDQILDDSLVFEYGGRQASLYELMVWMIVNSDNTSTNVLFEMLGYDAMNSYFRKMGLGCTSAGRKMLDFDAVKQGRNNYISPVDFYSCMRYLYDNRDDRYNSAALSILSRNRDCGSLCRYLYDDMKVMHKTGGLDDIAHDGGIFVTDRGTYFLGVFVSGFEPGPEMCKEAEKLMGRISRRVYEDREGRKSPVRSI